jgi:predicted HNH restriction endonuclease
MTQASKRSRVTARALDPVPWAITEYNFQTGAVTLARGVQPLVLQISDYEEPDVLGFEGALRQLFINHRRREWQLREKKIHLAKAANGGRLVCEVPGCGFDFVDRYGEIGEGYAQVHHLIPLHEAPSEGLAVSLGDLAIVCANCHVMIHRGGKCRPLEEIIAS